MSSKHILIDDKIFLDIQRESRTLVPEVLFAQNKNNEDLHLAISAFIEEKGAVFVSRLTESQIPFLIESFPQVSIDKHSRTAWFGSLDLNIKGKVALVAAGTSDLGVLDESKHFLNFIGIETEVFSDIGVASLGRLLHFLPEINKADILLVFAGMEGALPSVLAGLTTKSIIGVPTSIGYGVSKGGFSALSSILSSCSPGVLAVNIDNGIGAAAAAIRILALKG